MKAKKVGIIGCANVVPMSIIGPSKSIKELDVFAVASREVSKAKEFANKYNIPNYFGSYDEMIESPEVDFVYIALPNMLHTQWIIKAAEAKKHILVEKPICLNSKQAKEIENTVLENNIHILEGVMVSHHPWQKYVRDLVCSKKYGKLLNVKTNIYFNFKDENRSNYRSYRDMGGGAFYDFGTYWLQFIQCIIGLNPVDYKAFSTFDEFRECDRMFNSSMSFSNGVNAEFECSFEKPYRASHCLEFEGAVLKINDFFKANIGKRKISINIFNSSDEIIETKVFEPQNYFENQLRFFLDVLNGTKKNLPLAQSFERVDLMDKIYKYAQK